MSTDTITPTSEYDASTLAITKESAGGLSLRRGPGPVLTLMQKLADRVLFARDAVVASIGWNGDFSVDPGGTNATFAINLGTIGAVVTGTSGGVYRALSGGGVAIGATKILGGGNLANSTWHYVYCWDNAGTLDYEITTTAPSGSRRTKSGDATRRYLGCFRTTSAGAPIPVRASRGRYVYDLGGGLTALFDALSGGADTSFTAVSLASLVPPHARLATVRALATAGAAPGIAGAVEVQSYGSASTGTHSVYSPSVTGFTNATTYDIPTDSSQRVQYRVVGGGAAPTATIAVLGYMEG